LTDSSEDRDKPLAAFVLTDRPVPIRVSPLEDERTPEGMVCLGTVLNGRIIARCVVPPEALAFIEDRRLFDGPVPIALAAHEEAPGLQCRLFAVVSLPAAELEEDDEDEAEPWAASVPSSDFDREVAAEGDEPKQAAILLGHIVRFARDRRHPDNVGMEAADVLATIVSGEVSEVVDKVLEDLMGESEGPIEEGDET
jgi:hypothetical protein